MDYFERLSEELSDIDSIQFSVSPDSNANNRKFNPLVKMSSLLHKKFRTMAFVFPNTKVISKEYTVFELVRAIYEEEIHCSYNFSQFNINEKVGVGNATVIYKGINDNKIKLQCSDLAVTLPLKNAPALQKRDSNVRRLSKFETFNKEKEKIIKGSDIISLIRETRTHLDKTLIYINLNDSIEQTLTNFDNISLNGTALKDLIYITKLVNGESKNAFSSLDTGTETLLCCSCFFDVKKIISTRNVHSFIIQYSKRLESNPFFLQQIAEVGIPITFLADQIDFLESSFFSQLKTWIWDKDSIKQCIPIHKIKDSPTANYLNLNIRKQVVQSKIIDDCFLLFMNTYAELKKEPDFLDKYSFIATLYKEILAIARCPFRLRPCSDFTLSDTFSAVKKEINEYRSYFKKEIYESLLSIVDTLEKIHENTNFEYPKAKLIEELLIENNTSEKQIYIIISELFSKKSYQKTIKEYNSRVRIFWPDEYIKNQDSTSGICIITGWLKKNQMSKILFSYKTNDIYLVLYHSEYKRWASPTFNRWKELSSSNYNLSLYNELGISQLQQNTINSYVTSLEDVNLSNEESEINHNITLLKHHRYQTKDSQKSSSVEAYSIEFSNQSFMFVTEKHKMLVVSSDFGQVKPESVKNLTKGNYIAIRKSSKDIIREEADSVLRVNNCLNYRNIAAEWKDPLKQIFRDCNEDVTSVHDAIKKNGCSVILQTVRFWIKDPEMIMMDRLEDLESIIKTSRIKTAHSAQEIFEAGRLVREAHKIAGKSISEKMQQYLQKNKKQLLLSTGDTLSFELPSIGEIFLLEISEISNEKEKIDTKNLNKQLT